MPAMIRDDIDIDLHGRAAGYKSGCRCIVCKAWNTAKAREYREKRRKARELEPVVTWHRSRDLTWTAQAACQHQPTRLWFAGDGRNPNTKTARQALDICATCPVATDCLEYALELPPPWHGIFGGMTPQQRRAEYIKRHGRTPEEGHDHDTNTRTATDCSPD
jgi:WhiB family redox-sensing transcriptional regulator